MIGVQRRDNLFIQSFGRFLTLSEISRQEYVDIFEYLATRHNKFDWPLDNSGLKVSTALQFELISCGKYANACYAFCENQEKTSISEKKGQETHKKWSEGCWYLGLCAICEPISNLSKISEPSAKMHSGEIFCRATHHTGNCSFCENANFCSWPCCFTIPSWRSRCFGKSESFSPTGDYLKTILNQFRQIAIK